MYIRIWAYLYYSRSTCVYLRTHFTRVFASITVCLLALHVLRVENLYSLNPPSTLADDPRRAQEVVQRVDQNGLRLYRQSVPRDRHGKQ